MTIAVANVTTSGNTVYTSSGNTVITFLSLCNYSPTTPITANLCVVPNGSSPANTNIVFARLEIANSDTYQTYAGNEKLILGNGDYVFVNSTANTVTAVVSYTSA